MLTWEMLNVNLTVHRYLFQALFLNSRKKKNEIYKTPDLKIKI
jgi:hypothetical protein